MKRIKLTKGKSAIVDDSDYEWLSRNKWRARVQKNRIYAAGAIKNNGKWQTTSMHREIMGLTKGDGKEVDHRNGNGLDNRRENLRLCTRSENIQNRHHKAKEGKASQYQGVYSVKKKNSWLASITKDYKQIHIGLYSNDKDAARAYDRKALELFGPDAKTNFPKEDYNDH